MVELAGNKQKNQEITMAQLVVQWLMNYEKSHEKTDNLKQKTCHRCDKRNYHSKVWGSGVLCVCVWAFFTYTLHSALKSKKRKSQNSAETEPVTFLLKAQKR